MNENGKVGGVYSWPVIILALCFFWPVGVYLIIKRVSKDKKTAMGAGKFIGGLGIASFCIAVIGLVACVSSGFTVEDAVLILFFGAAGVVLSIVAKKIKKDAENVKQYLSIIINGNVRQLDTIASTTGKSYDVVHENVKKMIEDGYLRNAYIDEGLREIVLPSSISDPQDTANAAANAVPKQSRMVACSCCGANNTIYGDVGECEYCGSPLK